MAHNNIFIAAINQGESIVTIIDVTVTTTDSIVVINSVVRTPQLHDHLLYHYGYRETSLYIDSKVTVKRPYTLTVRLQ